MSDLISREQAIARATHEGAYGYISAQELAEMPSAEPQIIPCKDCKWHLFYHDAKYGVGYSLCGNPKNMLNDSMIDVSADGYCSRAERREEE